MPRLVFLVDILPRLGFIWPEDTSSPRILRRDARDADVKRALINVAGDGQKVRKRHALEALEATWSYLAESVRDSHLAIQDQEDMVSWLFRVRRAGGNPLASAIKPNVWVELVFRVVFARREYLAETSQAMQDGDYDRLSGFAHAVDRFWSVANVEWNRDLACLYMFAEPSLFGESGDWDGGEEDWN